MLWGLGAGCLRLTEAPRQPDVQPPVREVEAPGEALAPAPAARVVGPGRPFGLCLPADRSFAVGDHPVALTLLVGETPTLVVANAGSGDLSRMVRVDGEWREVQRVPTSAGPVALAQGDIDGDGRADIVALHRTSPAVSVHFVARDGALSPARRVPLSDIPVAMVVADLEDDGVTEILLATAVAGQDGYLRVLTLNRDAGVALSRRVEVARDPIAVAVAAAAPNRRRAIAVFHHGAAEQVRITQTASGALRWDRHHGLSERDLGGRGTTAMSLAPSPPGVLHPIGARIEDLPYQPAKIALYADHADLGLGVFPQRRWDWGPPSPHRLIHRDVDADGVEELLVFAGVRSADARLSALPTYEPPRELMPLTRLDLPVMAVLDPDAGPREPLRQLAVDGLDFVVADVTGDGRLDLAAVRGRLHVHDDVFGPKPSALHIAAGFRGVAAVDLGNDGRGEVLVEGPEACTLLATNRGAPHLRPLTARELRKLRPFCERRKHQLLPSDLLVADVDRDGDLERILSAGSGLLVLRDDDEEARFARSGRPVRGLENFPRGSDVRAIAVVPRPGAASDDLWISERPQEDGRSGRPQMHPYVVLHRLRGIDGSGPGSLERLGTIADPPPFVPDPDEGAAPMYYTEAHPREFTAAASGDLDGDGASEVLLLDRGGRAHALWGRADGGFDAPAAFGLERALDLQIADLDGDRTAELIVLAKDSTVRVYAPTGAELPAAAAEYGAGARPNGLAVADLDGDRRPEIVVGDDATRTLAVLRASACAAADPR